VPDGWPRLGEAAPPELIAAYVDRLIPRYLRTREHWLIPAVGRGQDLLPPVLLWWVLLFGLSLLARYEPDAWRAALDLDGSPVADPLAELLDLALVIVPEFLFDAVIQERAPTSAAAGLA